MNLTTMKANLKIDLADSTWDDSELERAVTKAVADLTRFLPDEKSTEFTFVLSITSESWTSSAAHGTYTSLANKPIKWGSETITSDDAATTYTRDTDYTFDYTNGKLTTIDGGSMAVDTAYKANYTNDKISLDISSLTDLIRVRRVEYPIAAEDIAKFVPFYGWGSLLFFTSAPMADKKHVVVHYEAECVAPGASTNGSYPLFLDNVILIGASGYAIMSRGLSEAHNGGTNYGLATTAIGTISNTDAETALGAVSARITAATTALAKITNEATAVSTALGKITTYTTDAETALDAVITNAVLAAAAIAKVDTLVTAIGTAIANVDAIIANGSTALDTVATQIGKLETALDAIAAIWTDEIDYRAYAHGYLTDGDGYINKVNIGSQVSRDYATYAEMEIGLARLSENRRSTKLGSANTYLNSATVYVNEAAGRVTLVNSWVAKAKSILDEVSSRIGEAGASLLVCDKYIAEANGRLGMSNAYYNEAMARVNLIANYVNEAGVNIAQANGYIAEAAGRVESNMLISKKAEDYILVANQQMELSRSYFEKAIEYRNEFWAIIRDKAQHRNEVAMVAQRQSA